MYVTANAGSGFSMAILQSGEMNNAAPSCLLSFWAQIQGQGRNGCYGNTGFCPGLLQCRQLFSWDMIIYLSMGYSCILEGCRNIFTNGIWVHIYQARDMFV